MCKVQYSVICCPQAEFMSPNGSLTNVPFYSVDKFFGSELRPLIKIIEERGVTLTEELSAEQKMDMRTHLTLVEDVFTSAEQYVSFVDKDVYNQVTYERIASVYPKLLGIIQNYRKKRSVMKQLDLVKYSSMQPDEVMDKVDHCCSILEARLENQTYMCGET